jgi:hypothetical protein
MSANLKIYLAKNQRITGPLSQEEVDRLRKNGDLQKYTWILKENDHQWTALDPAPAIPTARPEIQPPAFGGPLVSRPQVMQVEPSAYRIVLFDHHNAISGWLLSASDGGCAIRSDQNGSDPLFVSRAPAHLTLHDTRSGESIKLRIRIGDISRAATAAGDPGWVYQLRWESAPSILASTSRTPAEASVAA